ncbi:MAG: hypothetical protein WAM14_19420 [Candidatus Nitrosopolaris sp.]
MVKIERGNGYFFDGKLAGIARTLIFYTTTIPTIALYTMILYHILYFSATKEEESDPANQKNQRISALDS